MHRLAEAGFFPLVAAAAAEQAGALAFVAGLQTFACFALWFFTAAYFGRIGLLSSKSRGWSNGIWIVGVVGLAAIPSMFPGVSLPLFDYAITASISGGAGTTPLPLPIEAIYGPNGLNGSMLPVVFLVERGLVGALIAAGFALLGHDVGYRLREALEDFGFIESDDSRREVASARRERPNARTAGAQEESTQAAGANGSGFGQRGAPPSAAPQSAQARARAVLGVGAGATKREIERAYRSQMKRAHPDHGGSVERAAALNAARDALLRRG